MESEVRFRYLLIKYLKNDLLDQDKSEFFDCINSHQFDNILSDEIQILLLDEKSDQVLDLRPEESKMILNDILRVEKELDRPYRNYKLFKILAAVAAVFLVFLFIYLVIQKENVIEDTFHGEFVKQDYLEFTNYANSVQRITLADLSTIDVYPNSTIYYPDFFNKAERKVMLKGKAFFTIQPDSIHPFIVLSGNIKTKVLGTSFLIHSDLEQGLEEVEVSTGAVEVMRTSAKNNLDKENSVILLPNQKGIYKRNDEKILKTLVSAPKPLIWNDKNSVHQVNVDSFDYDQETIKEIVKDLQHVYGVNIILDKVTLGNCTFTGKLSDIDLFTKLKIICLATQSSYEINGTDVILRGGGCH